jgi:hypothetical protein
MRKRITAGVLLLAAAAGCGGPASPPRPAPSDDPLADCIGSITPWLQNYLDGGTDRGDYQEMGLSGEEGGALRDLQRQAAALRAQGPLPSGWAAGSVRQACTSIVAAAATATSKAPGWP